MVLDIYNLFGLNWAKKNTETPEYSVNPKPLFLFIVARVSLGSM